MPRKRKSSAKTTSTEKKKKILTRKLIQISLKVEDYVYVHKPISVGHAEMYLQEIAACKLQCSNEDLPSLQVIEKLTRQMKTIISEQQANARCDNDATDYRATKNCPSPVYSLPDKATEYCLSPVYSLPDEDKTQYYQHIAPEVNAQDFETIDLCDDDEVVEICVDVEEHTGMSDVSMRTNKDPAQATNTVLGQLTEDICSQSILDEFEPNTTNIVENITNGQVSNSQAEANMLKRLKFTPRKELTFRVVPKLDVAIDKPVISKVTSENNTASLNCDVTKANNKTLNIATAKINDENKMVKQNSNQRTKVYCTNVSTNIIKQDKINTKTDVKENATKIKRKPRKKKIPIDLTNNKLETTKNNRKLKVNMDLQNKKAANNTFAGNVLDTSIRHLNKDDFINKKIAENSTYVENTFVSSMRNLNKEVPIYNTNTDNDLSWLENIRYVREITDEEYDPNFKVPHNFWEDYTLPSFWSDLEFSLI